MEGSVLRLTCLHLVHVSCLSGDRSPDVQCVLCLEPVIPNLRDSSAVAKKLRLNLHGLPWVPNASLGEGLVPKAQHLTPREVSSMAPPLPARDSVIEVGGLDPTVSKPAPSPQKNWSRRSSDPDDRANLKQYRADLRRLWIELKKNMRRRPLLAPMMVLVGILTFFILLTSHSRVSSLSSAKIGASTLGTKHSDHSHLHGLHHVFHSDEHPPHIHDTTHHSEKSHDGSTQAIPVPPIRDANHNQSLPNEHAPHHNVNNVNPVSAEKVIYHGGSHPRVAQDVHLPHIHRGRPLIPENESIHARHLL